MIFFNIELVRTRTFICACLFIITFSSCKNKSKTYSNATPLQILEMNFKSNLETCISNLDSLEILISKADALKYYQLARADFKVLEPILAFVDRENYKFLNAPNILKIEEEDATDIKIKSPKGFQVLEEQIFEEPFPTKAIIANVKQTKNRLNLILNNTHLNLKNHHIIWLLRDEIARIALTGITGYDSPVLEQSLEEAKLAYNEIEYIISIYNSNFQDQNLLQDWKNELKNTQTSLEGSFNDFDRYHFIKNHTHKQLELLVKTQKDWNVTFPFQLAFNNEMKSLFSNETFNIDYFSDSNRPIEKRLEKITLGKRLFNDKKLSKSETISCATCHQKDKAFTDGLKVFPKQKRNTPTLRYAGLQKSFFYDGRAGSLEGQIVSVIENKDEFHSDLKSLIGKVLKDSTYANDFKRVYGKVSDRNIRQAIATYIRSLNTFNSKFDNNINGIKNTFTKSEINGFNIFNGKGKCATCHFAPVFNGTVPPNFSETELEAIGVPKTKEKQPKISQDLGRYYVFNTEERKHFFKTPTIRNSDKTAPYMHNGVYTTLDELMDFYNNGGGSGLGIEIEHQTLPSDDLNLSKKEINDVISFMKTLNDN